VRNTWSCVKLNGDVYAYVDVEVFIMACLIYMDERRLASQLHAFLVAAPGEVD
jgi:hypothetical protein